MNILHSIFLGFETLLRGSSNFITWFTTPTLKMPSFGIGSDPMTFVNQFTPSLMFQVANDYIKGNTTLIAPIWVVTTGLFAILSLFLAIRLVITILDAIPIV